MVWGKSIILLFRKVLATLDMTRKEAKTMRENMKTTHVKYEAAKQRTANLLNLLTGKATVSSTYSHLIAKSPM